MWDQSDEESSDGVPFGRSYDKEEIDNALELDDPYENVALKDETGHGTYMAGIACAGPDPSMDYSGMAPFASIGVVKLKDSKPYLKEYYGVREDVYCYQENDIMLGVDYLVKLANRYEMPLVICLGIGTNLGDHNGTGYLGMYLDYLSGTIGRAVCVPTGNEGNKRHHYRGMMDTEESMQQVEIRVGGDIRGFTLQLWSQTPDALAVGFESPTGAKYDKIPARFGESRRVRFIIEGSTVDVDYWLLQQNVGDELVEMRFHNPTKGIWKINIYNEGVINGRYDMWLPCTEFVGEETFFLRSDPDATITEPANASMVVSCAGFDHVTDSIYIASGRGYTRSERIKPDISAPALNVMGPSLEERYTIGSGTCIAAAFCAGAAALIFEWALVRNNDVRLTGNLLRKYMIRGARRNINRTYPDNEWGYGALDVYGIFEAIFR